MDREGREVVLSIVARRWIFFFFFWSALAVRPRSRPYLVVSIVTFISSLLSAKASLFFKELCGGW